MAQCNPLLKKKKKHFAMEVSDIESDSSVTKCPHSLFTVLPPCGTL